MEISNGALVGGMAANPATGPLRTLQDLPSPAGYPLLGNLPELSAGELHLVLERWAHEHGDCFRMRLGPTNVVVISDIELTRELARARPQTFRRMGKLADIIEEVIGPGVFTAEGEGWRVQRKLVMAALSPRNVKAFHPLITRSVERLEQRWLDAAERHESVPALRDLMLFTADVTTSIAFGVDVNTIERGEHALRRHLAHIFPAFERRLKAPFPYWRAFRLPVDRALDRAVVELRQLLAPIIEAARSELSAHAHEPGFTPRNFLEAILSAADDAGEHIGSEAVLGNALTLLLAGEDTTANTIAWAMHYLTQQPEVAEALRAELAQVCGDRPFTPELARGLPLMEAVLQETMRLKPTAAMGSHEALEQTQLGTLLLPAGTVVWTLTRPPVMDEARFVQPSEFRPARWQAPSADQSAAMLPFGHGPRICPGRSLALLEATLVLGMLVQNFDLERCGDAADVREVNRFTMGPEGLALRFVRRR